MMAIRHGALVLLSLAVAAAVAALAMVALASGSSSPSNQTSTKAHGLALASGSSPWKPTSPQARGSALVDARKRLRSFQPPGESRRVASLPKSLRLDGPFITIRSPNFLDIHAFWVSSESVENVRDYLRERAPPGSRSSSSSEAVGRHGTYLWGYGYSWAELPGIADERQLLVGVVARPGGGSALRVDAQAVWLESKTRTERIPADARSIEVVETLGGRSHTASTHSARKVEAVAEMLDGFPIVQRSGPRSCTAIPSKQAILRAYFRASPGGSVVAATKQTLPEASCQAIGLTIRGKEERPLINENEGLTKSLQALLSHKYGTPLSKRVRY